MQRPEVSVGLLQFLPDRQALRTVFLAFPASDALAGKRWFPGEGHSLDVLTATSSLRFGVHGIPASENTRNIHVLGTWHAVAATRASDFLPGIDLSFELLDEAEVVLREMSDFRFRSRLQVFTDHFN